MHANGYKLNWTSIEHAGGYVVVAAVPGQAYRYEYVKLSSDTPPPVPGQTVTYAVRTAVRNSHWSNIVKISYPAAPPAPTPTPPAGPAAEELNLKAAPALHVSGQTLTWNLVANVSAYILETKVPGQPEAFTAVSGTSTTPPAVPGKTVTYSVRTAVDGSAWAPTVTITYPAPPPAPKEPAPAPKEPSFSVIGSEGFEPGINSGTNPQDYHRRADARREDRPHLAVDRRARLGAGIRSVANYAAKGIRVAPLASFYGRIPSPAEAQQHRRLGQGVRSRRHLLGQTQRRQPGDPDDRVRQRDLLRLPVRRQRGFALLPGARSDLRRAAEGSAPKRSAPPASRSACWRRPTTRRGTG